MLSRVAEHLFWISRYIERAETVARLLDAARRMSALPWNMGEKPSNEWASILIAAGAKDEFGENIERATAGVAIDYLVFNRDNPSSIMSSFHQARENGRAIRFALTQDCWEALNGTWSEARVMASQPHTPAGLADIVDWAKQASATFRGAVNGSFLRGDGYEFMSMGVAIERTDATARLLDVKYHVLLPSVEDVGSGKDHYQWLSLLQAAAAQRAYFHVTQNDISARGVAEFLIMNDRFPRSICYNVMRTERAVKTLAEFYGHTNDCQARVSAFADSLGKQSVDGVFAYGLHEFLTDVIEQNYAVSSLLGSAYGFTLVSEGTGNGEENLGQ